MKKQVTRDLAALWDVVVSIKIRIQFLRLCCRLYRPVARKPWLTVYRAHAGWKMMKMIEQFVFYARLALEIDQGFSLRESLRDTWLVETIETDTKAAV